MKKQFSLRRCIPLAGDMLLVLFCIFCAFASQVTLGAASVRMNVLFIAVDDFNVALDIYGHPTAVTPNMDRLAAEGMHFDRAYAQDPLCNPSRSSFLSGRRPATTNVYGNFIQPRHSMGDVVMLPEYFSDHGYYHRPCGKDRSRSLRRLSPMGHLRECQTERTLPARSRSLNDPRQHLDRRFRGRHVPSRSLSD
ncbi:MAG: sulfatase-like hydrolase/transferase [Deltaproteobacteria bacterium]|nr:sulfatase-like hydrolase/transferase [Deltaproteobacteria bacterium]